MKMNELTIVIKGPMRLPIVGNLPLLGTNPLKTLSKWKEEYGPVVGMRFGDLKYYKKHLRGG
jgi:hypothetical protein